MSSDHQANPLEKQKEKGSFNLSRWAIGHPSIARFLFGLIIVMGALGVMNMGQKEDPDFTFRVMVVQAQWPGASIEDMQNQVVNKIERKLQETPHLDWIKSYTRAGISITTIQVKGDTNAQDVADAFYQVRKKIGDIRQDLPSGIYGPYFNDEFGDTYITLNAITGEGYSYPELKQYAIQARDMLLATPGVEKATILGDQPQKIFIDVSSQALAERGLTVNDISTALAGQNDVDASGSVETADRSVRISVEGGVTTPDDIKALRLRAGDQVFRLGDIATVKEGLEDPYQRKFRFNGHDSVQLGVVMANGYKVTDVGHAVEETYKRFEETLPVGVQVEQISNQPEVVTEAVGEFTQALLEALVIVLVVSLISIGWRSGIVIAIAIPLVLSATLAIMFYLGIELQRISLGALIIALGLLVDDAMIVVELMERKLEEGFERLDAASFAYSSTAFPMLTGTLITTAGFIPVGFADSTAGEYVRSLFYVVGIALVVSWFVAVYFTPWLGYMILKQRSHAGSGDHHDAYDTRMYRSVRHAVGWSVRHKAIVLIATLGAFAASLWSFQFIPQSFFPQSSRPEILVDMWLPEGTAIKEVERQAKALEDRILNDPDKSFVATYIGEGAPRFFLPLDQQLRNPNYAQLLIMSNGLEERERMIVKLRKILAEEFPTVRGKVDRLFLGPPTGWAVQMRVVGPDKAEVRRIADQVKARYEQQPDFGAIHDDWMEPVAGMKLVIDQDRARALGVLGGGVAGTELAQAFARLGSAVTVIARGGLLGAFPAPAAELVQAGLRADGVELRLRTGTQSVSENDDGSLTLALDGDGSVTVDKLLVATGRHPALEGLGLESVGLSSDDGKQPRLETDASGLVRGADGNENTPWLYAVGDAAGKVLLTHQGKYEARATGDAIAARARGTLTGEPGPWSPYAHTADEHAVPNVVFTDPELANVGRSLEQAEKDGYRASSVQLPIEVAGSSLHSEHYKGWAQLVVDEDRKVLLGATFAGPDVAELLHAATIAVVGEVPLDRLWHAVPSYPTISEVWLRLLEEYGL